MTDTISCKICGMAAHVISKHLKMEHADVSLKEYQEKFPDAPIYSDKAIEAISKHQQKPAAPSTREKSAEVVTFNEVRRTKSRAPLCKTFEVPEERGFLNSKGGQIPVTVFADHDAYCGSFVPDVDPDYEFDADSLKIVLMGLETGMNFYLFGDAGTGKSTVIEQAHARTKRPIIRVQHSRDTEESHVVGMYVVKDGATVWQPGILQICMKYGMTYLADEYDRAAPQVTSVYQAVLEGKPLIAKEAPEEWRVTRPHEDFRFAATGNTNGSGDETGLFVSTSLQDFANYERFALMFKTGWMDKDKEAKMITKKSGIDIADARRMVDFATKVRDKVSEGSMSSPISPRSLIAAARVSMLYGDFKRGLALAYTNRLNSSDREVCNEVLKRIF